MPRESKKSRLLSMLPVVEMKEDVRVFQKAEIEFGESGYKKMIYVAGRYESKGDNYLVYGNGIDSNGGIVQPSDVFDAIPFSQIGRYSPLKKR